MPILRNIRKPIKGVIVLYSPQKPKKTVFDDIAIQKTITPPETTEKPLKIRSLAQARHETDTKEVYRIVCERGFVEALIAHLEASLDTCEYDPNRIERFIAKLKSVRREHAASDHAHQHVQVDVPL